MNQHVTDAIILSRTDYGEADRILTMLTPDHGKLRLMAKGVRRVKSKLAGGIELFSVSTITFIKGRGEIGTLISTRLVKHYGHIVEDLDRSLLGYDLIKQFNKITEDGPGPEYFDLLRQTFEALDDSAVSADLVRFWFTAQLLRLSGHSPNLATTADGAALQPDEAYDFDFAHMCFQPSPKGAFTADHIKFLRLAFANHPVHSLAQVQNTAPLLTKLTPMITALRQQHLHL